PHLGLSELFLNKNISIGIDLKYQYIVYIFFQAEDGIRDFHVTGVQTCALPICPPGRRPAGRGPPARPASRRRSGRPRRGRWQPRSEERRVGKECRERW